MNQINFDTTPIERMLDTSNWRFVVHVDGAYSFDSAGALTLIQSLLEAMTPEQRLDVFRPWCPECGGPAPCQCWNDE